MKQSSKGVKEMAPHLLPAERLERIRQAVLTAGSVRVGQLAEMLSVSEVTVRTDLSQLEREGILQRTHGGAVATRGTRFERPFAEQETRYAAEKRRIGGAAAALVEEGDTIILDVGTTTTEVARQLRNTRDLAIVTSGLNIAMELERYSDVTVLVTGGTVRPMQHSLVNPYATLLLSQIQADKLFLGCNGLSAQRGITNSNLQEAEIKQAMIRAAKQVIVLADSSKIGAVAAARIAGVNEAHQVITDTDANPNELDQLRQAGLQVITV